MYKPLKISCYMQTNFICNDYINLDGILEYCEAQNLLEQGVIEGNGNIKEEDLVDIDIPIQKYFYNENKYIYMSSIGLFDGVQSIEKWKKKYPTDYIDYIKKDKVIINSGKRKDYNMPMICYSCEKIVFYCIGIRKEIEELLKNLYFIGKKSSQGYGKIRKTIIEDIELDKCNWKIKQFPISKEDDFIKILTEKKDIYKSAGNIACRPPYWAKKNIETCLIPY